VKRRDQEHHNDLAAPGSIGPGSERLARAERLRREPAAPAGIPAAVSLSIAQQQAVTVRDSEIDVRSARVSRWRRLLAPASGLPGQGVRYAIAGTVVALVYLSATTFLAVVVGLPFREALPIGFTLQLAVHFTLQRLFVWVHDEQFALPFRRQARRYLTVAGAQLGVTAASTSLLPRVLGLSTEAVYLLTVALLTVANFLLFRNLVFHPEPAPATQPD
jgi:putative flippase GtrA